MICVAVALVSKNRLEQLEAIERAAKDVVRMRQISRQAALNAMPDLVKAVGNPWQ
jgi:hypothetical protein